MAANCLIILFDIGPNTYGLYDGDSYHQNVYSIFIQDSFTILASQNISRFPTKQFIAHITTDIIFLLKVHYNYIN